MPRLPPTGYLCGDKSAIVIKKETGLFQLIVIQDGKRHVVCQYGPRAPATIWTRYNQVCKITMNPNKTQTVCTGFSGVDFTRLAVDDPRSPVLQYIDCYGVKAPKNVSNHLFHTWENVPASIMFQFINNLIITFNQMLIAIENWANPFIKQAENARMLCAYFNASTEHIKNLWLFLELKKYYVCSVAPKYEMDTFLIPPDFKAGVADTAEAAKLATTISQVSSIAKQICNSVSLEDIPSKCNILLANALITSHGEIFMAMIIVMGLVTMPSFE